MNLDFKKISFQNNGKRKLLILVGTRPEIIRLSAIIKKCRKYFDCLLAHTGQNYDDALSGVFFRELGIGQPDVYLDVAGENLGETMGNILNASYSLIESVRPDALLVLGDTNSCLSAISAKRLHVPIFHMEAGNRCKDECLPEETNRRIVDIISDVNLAYSEQARRYLAECGLPKERTFVVGSPMTEVLQNHFDAIQKSDVLIRLGLEKGKYILLSAHREENIDDERNFKKLFSAVNALAERFGLPILYSCHPRSQKRIAESDVQLHTNIKCHEPLGFIDYNCLQMNALAVVSDSGTLPEESHFYASVGHPIAAVSIRTSTERPEAMEQGCFVLAGLEEKGLITSVEMAVETVRSGEKGSSVADYTDADVSQKVVKIIQSYTDVVNRFVWRKNDL